MQLKLNIKEWQALQVLLETRRTSVGPTHLDDVEDLERIRVRMRDAVANALRDQETSLASSWLSSQRTRVEELSVANEALATTTSTILAFEDDEDDVGSQRKYPRKQPQMPRPRRRGGKKR